MRLGSLHRYWLSEADKKRGSGMLLGDYSGTGHASAIEGLISLNYLKVTSEVGDIRRVEITTLGRRKLTFERRSAKKTVIQL